jgi:DNA-binding beta-propeller fold protein YncE
VDGVRILPGAVARGLDCKNALRTAQLLAAAVTVLAVVAASPALAGQPTQTLSGNASAGGIEASISGSLAASTLRTFAPVTAASSGGLAALSPGSVPAGAGTARLLVSADGENVYAANRSTNVVSEYSRADNSGGTLTASGQVTLPTGAEPEGLVESQTGDADGVYIADYGINDVTEIERDAAGELRSSASAQLPAGKGPIGVAASPDGKSLYVADSKSSSGAEGGAVTVFARSTATGQLTFQEEVAAGTSAHDVLVSPDGKDVYVANYNENTISEYERSSSTGSLVPLGAQATVSLDSHPHGLAISPDGHTLYVTESQQNGKVVWFTRSSSGVLENKQYVKAGEYTESVAVSADGLNVYATNYAAGAITQYARSASTGALSALAEGSVGAGTNPEGIALSADGLNAYVAEYTGGKTGAVGQFARKLAPNEFVGTVQCLAATGESGPYGAHLRVVLEATGSAFYAPGGGQTPTKLSGTYRQELTSWLYPGADAFGLLRSDGLAVEASGASTCTEASEANVREATGSTPLEISTGISSPADGTSDYSGTVTLAGFAEPGAQVLVSDGAQQLGGEAVKANAQGEWSKQVTGLSLGAHAFTTRASSGNTTASNPVTVNVLAPTIQTPANGASAEPGTLVLSGTADPGRPLALYEGTSVAEGATPLMTVTPDGTGNWSATLTGVSVGVHQFVVRSVGDPFTSSVTEVHVEVPAVTTTTTGTGTTTGTTPGTTTSSTNTPLPGAAPPPGKTGVAGFSSARIAAVPGTARLIGRRILVKLKTTSRTSVTLSGYVEASGSSRRLALGSGAITFSGVAQIALTVPRGTLARLQGDRHDRRSLTLWLLVKQRISAHEYHVRELSVPLR